MSRSAGPWNIPFHSAKLTAATRSRPSSLDGIASEMQLDDDRCCADSPLVQFILMLYGRLAVWDVPFSVFEIRTAVGPLRHLT